MFFVKDASSRRILASNYTSATITLVKTNFCTWGSKQLTIEKFKQTSPFSSLQVHLVGSSNCNVYI